MTDDRPHVLIVEDEPELADIFSIWLSEDFAVETVTNGEAGLEKLDPNLDVIVLDWRIPDVSGEEILSEMRTAGLDASVAVITGADPEVIDVDDGVDVVLRKPIRSQELVGAIQDLV